MPTHSEVIERIVQERDDARRIVRMLHDCWRRPNGYDANTVWAELEDFCEWLDGDDAEAIG